MLLYSLSPIHEIISGALGGVRGKGRGGSIGEKEEQEEWIKWRKNVSRSNMRKHRETRDIDLFCILMR